jgi:hypothetical protein
MGTEVGSVRSRAPRIGRALGVAKQNRPRAPVSRQPRVAGSSAAKSERQDFHHGVGVNDLARPRPMRTLRIFYKLCRIAFPDSAIRAGYSPVRRTAKTRNGCSGAVMVIQSGRAMKIKSTACRFILREVNRCTRMSRLIQAPPEVKKNNSERCVPKGRGLTVTTKVTRPVRQATPQQLGASRIQWDVLDRLNRTHGGMRILYYTFDNDAGTAIWDLMDHVYGRADTSLLRIHSCVRGVLL